MKFKDVDLIINLQGDEPEINIEDIVNLKDKMINYQSKMGTLAAKIENEKDFQNENIVKVQTKSNLQDNSFSEAEAFLRISKKLDNTYNHIGIYCYSTETLEKFVELDQTKKLILENLKKNIVLGIIYSYV